MSTPLAFFPLELELATHRQCVARFIVSQLPWTARDKLRLLMDESVSSDLFDPLSDALDEADSADQKAIARNLSGDAQ